MTSQKLADSWASVQQLVEDLRPAMVQMACSTEAEAVRLRPELIQKLQALGHNCHLAQSASAEISKSTSKSQGPGMANPPQQQSLSGVSQHKYGQPPLASQQQQQQQQQQAAFQDRISVPHVATVSRFKPTSGDAAGPSSSPKLPMDAEVPKFPFSIVRPTRNAQSRQSEQRHGSASPSPSVLPVGAVVVGPDQSAPSVTLPDKNALDAHEHAAERLVHMLSSAQAQPAASPIAASVTTQDLAEQSQSTGKTATDLQPHSVATGAASQQQDSSLPGIRLNRSVRTGMSPSRLSTDSPKAHASEAALQTSGSAGPLLKKRKVTDT